MRSERSTKVPDAALGGDGSSDERVANRRLVRLLREFAAEYAAAVEPIVATSQVGRRKVHAVVLLATRRQATMKQLTAETGLSRAAATDVVGRLCEAGMAERTRRPADRRTTLVHLTPRGIRAAERAVTRLAAVFDHTTAMAKDIVTEVEASTSRQIDAPTPPIGTDELAVRISALGVAIWDAFRAGSPVAVPEGRALRALLVVGDRGVARPSEIAGELGLSSGGMTYVLERLEQRGLVRRAFGDLDDRRAVTVTLTDRGDAVVDALHDAVAAFVIEVGDVFALVRDHTAATADD